MTAKPSKESESPIAAVEGVEDWEDEDDSSSEDEQLSSDIKFLERDGYDEVMTE